MTATDVTLRILGFAARRDRLSIGDVVRDLGVSRSAAYRALRTLEQHGYLLLSPRGRGYGPGPALAQLAELPAVDPASRRRRGAVLEAVRDATGETVHAAVLVGGQVLVVDGRRSAHEEDMGSRIGMTASAHAMAAGKLLLAALDERLVIAIADTGHLSQRTARTIAQLPELLAELERIRHDRYACAVGESETGIDSVAVALDGEGFRERVALVVSVPTGRGGQPRLRRLAIEAAAIIARAAERGEVRPWRLPRTAAVATEGLVTTTARR